MITRAKFEKAVDEAYAQHMIRAFNVMATTMDGASQESKDTAVRKFAQTAAAIAKAHESAMAAAPAAAIGKTTKPDAE